MTRNELGGAWIQLTWPSAMRIAQVNLFDRPSTSENALAGTLFFSDGSSIAVGALPPAGHVQPVTFAPKTVTWVRFRIDQAAGTATGLAEIQVLGVPASSTANNPPYFVFGPAPAQDVIPASQSTLITAGANDLDGDTLSYQWSTDGGSISGMGWAAVFTPPAVQTSTYFTITVTVSDGRGGTATNSTFVDVTPASTDSVSVAPAVVIGGDGATGTVVLATAAPAGGRTVTLSSDSAAVTVPASVTVAAGQTTATFSISTASVSSSATATVSASLPGGTRTTTLGVMPRSVTLSLSPSTVLGGATVQGTVTLPAVAGSATVVQLSSSDTVHAAVPATVTVPAGSTSATFSLTTTGASTSLNVTIAATFGTTSTAVLTVGPLALASVTASPSSVISGTSAQGTVALNGVTATAVVVSLASTNAAAASVPSSVTIPTGASQATFTIATGSVAASTSVTITAAYGSSSVSGVLTVTPQVPISNPNLLSSPEQIGASPWQTLGSLTLSLNSAAAPDGTQHATQAVSSGAGHALLQQASVIAGTTYTFSFFARNNGGSGASYSVYDNTHYTEIVAPASYFARINGTGYTRVSVTFTVPAGCSRVNVYPLRDGGLPVNVLLWGAKLEVGTAPTGYDNLGGGGGTLSLAIAPSSILSGNVAPGILTLSAAAPAGGTTVALSSNSAAATVPTTVTIPAGATTATFSVTTYSVSTATSVTISASFGGVQVATLTVVPRSVTLSLSPISVLGGGSAQGTVTLPLAAGPAASVVQLASGDAHVSVPATVTVPAGSTSATFTITTAAVSTSLGVAVTATYGNTSSAVLTLGPLAISSLTLSPTSVVGGASAQGTVVLNGVATASTVVALTSGAVAAAVPASVTIPAGASQATFAISTSAVATTTTAPITATYGVSSVTTSLTLQPRSVTLNLSPTSVLGGSSAQGTVTLPLAAGPAAVVQLASGDAHVSVPATVTVPAGSTSATFTITTAAVSTSLGVAVTATYGNTSSAVLTLGPLAISSLTLSPTSVVGGASAQGTVVLNGVATASTVVALTSGAVAAAVPASVTIPAGASQATFAISTSAVATTTTAPITATYGVSSVTTSLTVGTAVVSNPNLLASPNQIGASPWQALGAVTLTLNAALAPDGTQTATRGVSSGGGHAVLQQAPVTPGGTYTFSFYAKNNGGTGASYSVYDNTHYAEIVAPTSYFARINGTGYTRVSVTFTVPAGCSWVNVYPLRDGGLPVDVLLWGAKLEVGSTAT